MKKILFAFILSLAVLFACNNKKILDKQQKQFEIQRETIVIPTYNGQKNEQRLVDYDYTAPYVCPNHCPGSGSDKPGKCPVCGKDLIPNPNYKQK